MLKWAVNQPRPSYLEGGKAVQAVLGSGIDYNDFHAAAPIPIPTPISIGTPFPTPQATPAGLAQQRFKLKKRNSLLPALNLGKENQLTSTPLPAAASTVSYSASASSSSCPRTPLLRDLSNIMTPATPTTTAPLHRARSQLKPTTVYASTLPTFEAEFSPSYGLNGNNNSNNIIPGPLLALRGMGIPDSYFEKPRYLEQKPLPQLPARTVGAAVAPPPTPAPAPVAVLAPAALLEQTTLSSTQMGDVTLERMIDAILESTRKAPVASRPGAAPSLRSCQRLRQRQRQHHRQEQRLISTARTVVHSPTYRPAFDPASDLCEYWQPDGYQEREVRSPQEQAQPPSGSGSGGGCGVGGKSGKRRSLQLQLRRQRVVRRKRKITTKISSSVRQSAQKLLAAASRSAQKLPHSRSRHISPDSGHNSTSDCDFGEEAGPFGVCLLEAATKRRLSFSFHEDISVEK
ncbi:GH17637 [Drosophila grimshawi]|uniref:GH17637 n=1 Tax=Drosophila grimshawi TaxID=7222 RepID=B4JX46_DROGR|nr:GH17637 [Drosophila grimshawi]